MLGKNISERGAYWETQGYGNTPWPQCGEIDIMEQWGDNQDYVSSAIHTPSSFGGTVNVGGRNLPNASTEFHTYSMVWTEEEIRFSVDGVTHYVYQPDVQNPDTWPFDAEQYILFNVAILPIIDPSFTESAMEVDYIRIYQESPVTGLETVPAPPEKIFPNPFGDTFYITNPGITQDIRNIRLFDTGGKLIQTQSPALDNGTIAITPVGSLPAGMYYLQYQTGNVSYIQKVVKQ